jgi:phosphate transport system substrate-binding protein
MRWSVEPRCEFTVTHSCQLHDQAAWLDSVNRGAGASFPAPLYSKWAADYNKATGVRINYQSVGSGAGIKQIDAKTVDFGASDAPLKDEDLVKKGLVQFPTVIGGVCPWSTSRALPLVRSS